MSHTLAAMILGVLLGMVYYSVTTLDAVQALEARAEALDLESQKLERFIGNAQRGAYVQGYQRGLRQCPAILNLTQ